MDVALLAPEEPEPEPVLDVAELAPEDLPSDQLPESEPLVTRTIAELYARQGLTERALGVYRQLLQASPGDRELRSRVEELEGVAATPALEPADDTGDLDHAWTTAGGARQDEVETPFAWTASEEAGGVSPPEPSARAYFDRMLAWEPGAASVEGRPSPEGDA